MERRRSCLTFHFCLLRLGVLLRVLGEVHRHGCAEAVAMCDLTSPRK